MEKVLGIVVTNYPYGFGEPFLKDEIDVLSKNFDRIIIIIPSNSQGIFQSEQLFELPPNVFILPIFTRYTLLNKIWAFVRIGPYGFFRALRTSNKYFNLPFSWDIIKVFMSYVAKEASFRRRLIKEIKRQKFDIKHLVLYTYWFTEFTLALFKLKKKYPEVHVYSRAHGWDVYFERHNPAYLPFRKIIIPGLDGTFTVSDHAKNYLLNKIGDKNGKIVTSRLGVSGFGKNPFVYQKGKINILSIAFISPVKNLELLIDALAKIPTSIEICWFHIGDGDSYGEEVKNYAHSNLNALTHVRSHFLGNLTHAQIEQFLSENSIDLLFSTSHYEGLPVSMMEALSSGIPIVGPKVGGITEIIKEGENGYLLSEKPNSDEVVETLLNYAQLSVDQIQVIRDNAFHIWERDFNSSKNYQDFANKLLTGVDNEYRACSKCILDSHDYPDIILDADGVCNICHTYDEQYVKSVFFGIEGERKLQDMLSEIKQHGKNAQYDCLIGVSGGVDSTYLAYLCKQWGLRPLVLHVDNGWDSEMAVKNIENIINKLGFDLYTEVVNWEEMKSLQLAFFKASVVDTDVPTDNTYIASMYKIARKFKLKYVLTGHNTVTEGWLPPNFNHFKYDLINTYDIHKRFGTVKLKSIPLIGVFGLWKQKNIHRIKTFTPLNYVRYNKADVKQIIKDELGWKDYGAKHYENIFTRFYQGYILPGKFKVNKRKAHLSTLICSGQITREQALIENSEPLYNSLQLKEDRNYFLKKLNLSESEFIEIMQKPPVPHIYYKSYINIINLLRPFGRFLRRIGLRK